MSLKFHFDREKITVGCISSNQNDSAKHCCINNEFPCHDHPTLEYFFIELYVYNFPSRIEIEK